jgi:hypothetical protein
MGKITEVVQIFGLFFKRKKLLINFVKNGLGYVLGDFFTNSPGHPGSGCCTDGGTDARAKKGY